MLSVFIYRSSINKVQGYKNLITALIFAILQSIVEFFFFFARLAGYQWGYLENSYLPSLEIIPYAIVFLFILIHFSNFNAWDRRIVQAGYIIIFSLFVTYLINVIFDLPPVSTNLKIPTKNDCLYIWFLDFFQLYVVSVCLVGITFTFVKSVGNKAQYHTLLLWISFFIAFIVAILEFLEHIVPLDTYGAIGFGLALGVTLIIYLIDPKFVLFTSAEIFNFLIINKNGTTLFSASNYSKKESEGLLIGGMINAFAHFISEVTNSSYQLLKYVELKDRVMITKEKDDIIGVLIVDKRVKIFETSLERFVIKFNSMFREQIFAFSGDASLFDDAVKYIPLYFPFVDESKLTVGV